MGKLILTPDESNRTQLSRDAKTNRIKRVARGVYVKDAHYDWLEVYSVRYPTAIFTLDTMFSIYGMTDRFIGKYVMSMARGSRTIRESRIRQIRQVPSLWGIGRTELTYRGLRIAAYDKERLLIELFRFEHTLSKALYPEVIRYYRENLSIAFRVPVYQEYCSHFRERDKLMEKFRREIL